MSDRLISADKLIQAIHNDWDDILIWDESGETTADEFERLVLEQLTVDAVEVVRCKDCKYSSKVVFRPKDMSACFYDYVCFKWDDGCPIDKNGYCSDGERKEDAEKTD